MRRALGGKEDDWAPTGMRAVLSTLDRRPRPVHLAIVSPLRAATYQTLIGLLAASGLWIGEAIKLDRSDLDWAQGVLLIRESKFGNYAEGVVMPSLVTGLVAGGNSAQDSSAGQTQDREWPVPGSR